ncbi:hypothetical protein [Actinophytocola oryzae]|uniref:hypothetical protein n=1 Tax=Actinophytocola oryzae TaxID=502181 RepID=UPI0010627837|nr:hypothetical protein [Actinophytocola oryzae]
MRLLADYPAPPRTQAAALRLIAEVDGVEHVGPVTDPLGREGTAVRFTSGDGESRLTTELVLAADGTLLTVRGSGLKNYYSAVLSSGWTDETPHAPSAEVP